MSEQLDDDVEEIEVQLGEPEEEGEIAAEGSLTGAEPFEVNLAMHLDDDALMVIGQERQEILTDYKNSRASWEERIQQGIKWLGLSTDDSANEDSIVEDSCTAVHPLLMENVVKFQSKAIQELWPAKGPVRTKLKGYTDAKREAAAQRVRTYMNFQMTEQVKGFYSDLERNLFRVAFMGTGVRKVGWNAATNSPDPSIVHIENFYVDPSVTHLKHADEYIEVMPLSERKLKNLQRSGMFKEYEGDEEATVEYSEITEALNRAQGFEIQYDRRGYLVAEAHCYLDLDGADPLVPEDTSAPYIVHFNVQSGFVYAVRRNWKEGDPNFEKRLWYSVDQFIPAFGFYSLGFVHLIGDLTASSTAALRALVDAGQAANWPGGYKSQDAKVAQPDEPLGFGEFRDVNIPPEELAKAFFPLPVKEPSQVLFQLLQYMVQSGQKFADTTDQVVQESSNYGPVATTLALLEASQRFYNSIHKRLHESQREFFQIVGLLNFENLPERTTFVAGAENMFVMREDFNPEVVDVLPASDPNAMSDSQRVAKAQIELEMAARFPQLHDMKEVLRRFYGALGAENIDKLMPDMASKALSADPLTELHAAMKGQPIAAKLGQNHAAHIAVKEAFLKTPQMQGVNDQTIATGLELIKANIAEHKVLIFVAQVGQLAQQMGLQPQDEMVQAQLAQKVLQISAESGMGGELDTEQQMLKLQQRELDLADERIQSQNIREAAKITQKNRELDLKELQLTAEIAGARTDRKMRGAEKVLDNAAKLAQIDAARLSKFANEDKAPQATRES